MAAVSPSQRELRALVVLAAAVVVSQAVYWAPLPSWMRTAGWVAATLALAAAVAMTMTGTPRRVTFLRRRSLRQHQAPDMPLGLLTRRERGALVVYAAAIVVLLAAQLTPVASWLQIGGSIAAIVVLLVAIVMWVGPLSAMPDLPGRRGWCFSWSYQLGMITAAAVRCCAHRHSAGTADRV